MTALGRAVYTSILNERDGIESDLTAIRITEQHYRFFVGTTTIKRGLTWLTRHLNAGEQVAVTDTTAKFAIIVLMGRMP